jgi:hypothetical protein
MSTLKDVTEDAERALAIGFLPVLQKVAGLLKGELAKPATIQSIKDFGTALAGGLDKLIGIAQRLPWGAIGDSLKIAGAGAKAVLDAFLSLPDWVQTAVITGWGLNKLTGGALSDIFSTLAGGLIKGVLGMTAGVVNINAAVVNGGAGGLPGVAEAAGAGGAGLVATAAALAASVIGVLALNFGAQQGANQVNDVRGTNFKVPAGFLDFPTIISNLAEAVKVFNNNTPKGTEGDIGGKIDSLGDRFHSDTVDIGGHIDNLTKRFPTTPQAPKTVEQATAILAAGAQRDKETSDAINTIVAQQATSNDIETLRGNIAQGLQTVDTSTMQAGHLASIASTQAGFGVARQTFASGIGIESAIHSIDVRPIITVQISATDVTQVNVVEDRGGSRSGSRDGDGGGGPGQ